MDTLFVSLSNGSRKECVERSEADAKERPVILDRVPCSVCQHDVPLSEAVIAEATDYLMYFCGLDCYARWRSQLEA